MNMMAVPFRAPTGRSRGTLRDKWGHLSAAAVGTIRVRLTGGTCLNLTLMSAMGRKRTLENGQRYAVQMGKSGARPQRLSPITSHPSDASMTMPLIQRLRTIIMA